MNLIFLLFVLSCSLPKVKGPYNPQKPKEGKAIVYIYRLDTSIDSANPDIPTFYVNEKKQGKLMIGGHYSENVDVGNIEIAYKGSLFGLRFPWKSQKLRFTAKPNHVYYVRFSIEGMMRITQFKLVPNSQAQSEMVASIFFCPSICVTELVL